MRAVFSVDVLAALGPCLFDTNNERCTDLAVSMVGRVWNASMVEEAEAWAAREHDKKVHAQKQELETEYQTKLDVQAAADRQSAIDLAEERLSVIEDLRVRVNALDKVFSWNSDYQRTSHQVCPPPGERVRCGHGTCAGLPCGLLGQWHGRAHLRASGRQVTHLCC